MRKIFICSQSEYIVPFHHLFKEVSKIEQADVVMFTGGADVCPALYHEPCGLYTHFHKERDMREIEYADYAIAHGLPMLGICRGSQFLTVMAGGKLVQDVTDHCRYHEIYTNDEPDEERLDPLFMSSTHHQMMHPYGLDSDEYKVLAYARHRSKHYLDGWNRTIPHSGIEPEIVYYPLINALAIQGHPEIMGQQSEGVKYCQQLVKDYLCV